MNECGKLSPGFLAAHPNLPRGAMFMDGFQVNQDPNPSPLMGLAWPTQIGSTTYLNYIDYNLETKKLDSGDNDYMIFKYVVTGDSFTIFDLPNEAKKRIQSRLGDDYNSSDLLQEITKATEWKSYAKLDRIRL
jgi:hypothetical protein